MYHPINQILFYFRVYSLFHLTGFNFAGVIAIVVLVPNFVVSVSAVMLSKFPLGGEVEPTIQRGFRERHFIPDNIRGFGSFNPNFRSWNNFALRRIVTV
jgi:hypothetical protein